MHLETWMLQSCIFLQEQINRIVSDVLHKTLMKTENEMYTTLSCLSEFDCRMMVTAMSVRFNCSLMCTPMKVISCH